MIKCHELFGFMSSALAAEILAYTFTSDKPLYRTTLNAVAGARKVRPVFLERKPVAERHPLMVSTLSRLQLEASAAELLRTWCLKAQTALLTDFLNAMEIPHQQGVVEKFPASVEDTKLHNATETLLAKHPQEKVVVYLNVLNVTQATQWKNLEALLDKDPRLQFK